MNKQGNMVIRNVNADMMGVFEVTGFADILNIGQLRSRILLRRSGTGCTLRNALAIKPVTARLPRSDNTPVTGL